TLTIRASISAAGMDVRVDDIFFVPLGSRFAAFVVDPEQQWLTAVLGPNGACRRWFHNHLHETVAQTGPAGNLLSLNAAFSCLQTNTEFDPANPNRTLGIMGRGNGFFDEFKDGALTGYDLLNSGAPDWKIDGGSLRLVAPGPNPAGYGVRQSNFTATSLAVYVLVDSSPDNTIRVGTGSYYVIWTGTEWQLCRSDGGALTVLREEKSIGFQTEWILCVFENRLLFCADGI